MSLHVGMDAYNATKGSFHLNCYNFFDKINTSTAYYYYYNYCVKSVLLLENCLSVLASVDTEHSNS